MFEITEQDKQIMEALAGQKLTEKEVFEAKFNLLGLFNALYKIDQRLKKAEQEKEEGAKV